MLDAYGHVSARSDKRAREHFVMSRSLAPALVTAADLMELDADSEPLPGDKRKGFIERYIHGEIYRARPEVMAVVHSHSPSVIPFGVDAHQAAADLPHGLVPVVGCAGFRDPERNPTTTIC